MPTLNRLGKSVGAVLLLWALAGGPEGAAARSSLSLGGGGGLGAILAGPTIKSHNDARLLRNSHSVRASHHVNVDSLRDVTNDVKLTKIAAKEAVGVVPTPKTQDGWMATLGGVVERAMAPLHQYAALVDRYQKWYRRYNSLKKNSAVPLNDALDALRLEYMKTDERLSNRLCNAKLRLKYAAEAKGTTFKGTKTSASASVGFAAVSELGDNYSDVTLGPEDVESVDFIYHLLLQTVSVLESKLSDAESGRLDASELKTDPIEEEKARKALERLKSITVATAQGSYAGDIMKIAKETAIDGAAAAILARAQDKIPALHYLAPLVMLLGVSNRIPAVKILMSPDFRSALAVINKSEPTVFYRCMEQPGLRPSVQKRSD